MDAEEEVEETLPLDLNSFEAGLLYLQLQIAFSKYLDLIEYWGEQLKLPIEKRVEYKGEKPSNQTIGETIGTYKAFSESTAKILKDIHSIVEELGSGEDKPKVIQKPTWSKQ